MVRNRMIVLIFLVIMTLGASWHGLGSLLRLWAPQAPERFFGGYVQATSPTAIAPLAKISSKIDLDKLRVKEIRKLDLDCNPAVAPDGEHYVCERENSLWYGSLANGLEKQLLDISTRAYWLPDGKRIVYFAPALPGQPDELKMLNLETGEQSGIVGIATPDTQIQALSDEEVYFSNHGEIFEWNPLSGTTRPAFSAAASVASGLYWTSSPDGQFFAIQKNTNEIATMLIVNRKTGKKVVVTDKIDAGYRSFVWSPDGQRVFYSIVDPHSSFPELWSVNKDMSQLQLIWRGPSRGAFERLTWMPDGQTLLLVHAKKTGSAEVDDTYYAVDTTTGNQKALFMNGSGITLFNNGRSLLFHHNLSQRATYIAELEW